MATIFALMLSYPGETCSAEDAATPFAAYITGNVAGNLFGRLMSAALADYLGLATNCYVFVALNLTGAVRVFLLGPDASDAGRQGHWSLASVDLARASAVNEQSNRRRSG